ncbi:MAG: hypothetical protein E7241_05195 [Lachnospiraceae bacterium]|jgi:hypothetical protein|nr:hypothetical protein [Lachnospiraceae bacterium]
MEGVFDRKEYMRTDAAKVLKNAAETIQELSDINARILDINTLLHKRLKENMKSCNRITQAAIYFSETYDRMTPSQKKEFDRIGLQVINDCDLYLMK